jgi:DNA-binding response OmpR family regulator
MEDAGGILTLSVLFPQETESMTTPDDDPATPLRVLVIEDTASVATAIQSALRQAGMQAEIAPTGEAAIALHDSFQPDILLVDLGLPDMDGLELVARFANIGGGGIIVITANGEEATRVQGLETGADDYIVKPLALRELVARVRAVHRRVRHITLTQAAQAQIPAPRVTVDPTRRELRGQAPSPTLLTEAEFIALTALIEADGGAVSRDALSRAALRRTLHSDDRSVDQLILKLRRKLSEQGASPRTILSARSQGYLIADPSLFHSGTES